MHKDLKPKVRAIEEILKAAHRGRDMPKVRDSFSSAVMREVRSIGRLGTERAGEGRDAPRDSVYDIEARTVWKFAAATALLALLVCGYFYGSDPSTAQYELAEAAGDSSALILSLALI